MVSLFDLVFWFYGIKNDIKIKGEGKGEQSLPEALLLIYINFRQGNF
jgi:hypothetical protein